MPYADYDYHLAMNRERQKTLTGKINHLNANRAYRKRNAHKYKAHNAVNNALRDGKITKPDACVVCGVIGKIEAHHTDYSKPLNVQWLCESCHKKAHRENR